MSLRKRLSILALTLAGVVGALILPSVSEPAPAHAYGYYYGALALSTSERYVGRALDYDSYAEASQAALRACGYADCKVVTRFANGCGAIAESPSYWGFGNGSSLYSAQSEALYYSGSGAEIIYWACTSAHD